MPEGRLAVRQERSAPIRAPLVAALAYIAKYRNELGRFLTDGRVEINNTVKRTIRPIALNQKNVLFARHYTRAESWAAIASLIEPCKMNRNDPHA